MIDLYGGASPNGLKIVLMLEELELPYRLIDVKVLQGAQYSPDFIKLNPLSKYPVIVDPDGAGVDQPIFESGAILQYLCETYDRSDLLPRSGRDRWEVLKWLNVQVSWVGPMFGQHVHFRIQPSEAGNYASTRYRNQVARICEILDRRLQEFPYLAGAQYSIADIATYPWMMMLPSMGFAWGDYPALKKWFDTIAARPAAARMQASYENIAAHNAPARNDEDYNRFFMRKSGPKIDYAMLIPES